MKSNTNATVDIMESNACLKTNSTKSPIKNDMNDHLPENVTSINKLKVNKRKQLELNSIDKGKVDNSAAGNQNVNIINKLKRPRNVEQTIKKVMNETANGKKEKTKLTTLQAGIDSSGKKKKENKLKRLRIVEENVESGLPSEEAGTNETVTGKKKKRKEASSQSGEESNGNKKKEKKTKCKTSAEADALKKKKKARNLKKKKKLAKKRLKKNEGQEDSSSTPSESTAMFHALEYLRKWKSQRSEWSFQKVRQVWLLKNMYEESKVNAEDFNLMVEYLQDLAGKGRQSTVENAEKLISTAEDDETADGPSKISEEMFDRLRRVIQVLS